MRMQWMTKSVERDMFVSTVYVSVQQQCQLTNTSQHKMFSDDNRQQWVAAAKVVVDLTFIISRYFAFVVLIKDYSDDHACEIVL